jgi:hypothetical protein
MDELRNILGDSALTNVLLAANIVVVSRVFPWARLLSEQLTTVMSAMKPSRVPRAKTDPGV